MQAKWTEGYHTRSTIVLDSDVPLLYINVWGAILAHSAEFHHVAVWRELLDGVQQVDAAHDGVCWCVDRPLPVNHGVWCASLLPEMYHCLWLKLLEHLHSKKALKLEDVSS